MNETEIKVKVEEHDRWKRVLQIEVPVSVVDSEMESIVREYRQKAVLPGFRRGRAPADLLQAQFGHTMETEFLTKIVPSAYEKAVEQAQLFPVTMPEFSDVKFKPGEPLTFRAVVEVKPKVHVRGYKNMKLVRQQFEVEDWQVNDVLERLRHDAARLSPVDREAKEGDVLKVDYQRVDRKGNPLKGSHVKDYMLELGSPVVLKDFSEGLVGAAAGERRRIEVTYPKDFPSESLAGTKALFSVKVKEINEKIVQELDDNFARDVMKAPDLEGLRSRILVNLETSERLRSQNNLEGEVIERLLRENECDLPEGLVTDILERVSRESPEEKARQEGRDRESVRPLVERSLKRQLILEAIAQEEKLSVSEEEIRAGLGELAGEESRPVEAVRKELEEKNKMERFVERLLERKVLSWIIDNAQVEVVKRKPSRTESATREV